MSDLTSVRSRESEPEPESVYDQVIGVLHDRRERTLTGRIVVTPDDVPLEQSRQGLLRFYLNSEAEQGDPAYGSAVLSWDVFYHVIRNQSGMHRHQGGLVIYIVSGKGHTIVDDQRIDWRAGDLCLLPVVPGGVAHQHFNAEDSDEPVVWVAFIYRPMHDALGSFVEQIAEAVDFAH